MLVPSRQSRCGLCRAVRAKLVGDQNIRRKTLFLKQLAYEFHGRSLVASPLHKEVENLAFVVNRAPQPELRPPITTAISSRCWPRTPAAKLTSERRPEFQYPSPHRFAGPIQSALREQILDVAITERETHIEPNGVPDDGGRKLAASKGDRHAQSYPASGCALPFA